MEISNKFSAILSTRAREFVSVDSGGMVGWCHWRNGILIDAGTCHFDRVKKALPYAPFAVVEIPDHFKVRTKDVLTCTFRAGFVSCMYPEYKEVGASTWKGQVPKKISNRRAVNLLSPREREIVEGRSNHCLDAVGLGLWYMCRKEAPK